MKVLKSVLSVSLALATCGAAMASTGGAGIFGTRHDFATRSNFLGTQTEAGKQTPGEANQVGQCAFCHTPHNAQSTQLLWNKTASENTFTWDVASTSGGTEFASMGPSYSGPTVKCLACHDGSVAIGDVTMYKGKQNTYNTFLVGQTPVDANGTEWAASTARPQFIIGGGGNISGSHPVGMPYPDARNARYNNVTIGSNVVLDEFQPVSIAHQISADSKGGGVGASSSGSPVAAGGGNQASLIRLYNDTTGLGTIVAGVGEAGTNGMECSTCHDPHNKQTVDDWLLRGQNQGSSQEGGYICLQCHIK